MKKILCFIALLALGCYSSTVHVDPPFEPDCYDNTPRTLLTDTIPQLHYDTLSANEFGRFPTTERPRGERTVFTVTGSVFGVQRWPNGKIKLLIRDSHDFAAYIADPSCAQVANSPIGNRSRAVFDTIMARYPNMPLAKESREGLGPIYSASKDTIQITGVGFLRAHSSPFGSNFTWELEPVLNIQFK